MYPETSRSKLRPPVGPVWLDYINYVYLLIKPNVAQSDRTSMRAILLFLLPSAAFADSVTMKNGDVFRGKVLSQESGRYLQIQLKDDNEKRLQWGEIAHVDLESDSPSAETPGNLYVSGFAGGVVSASSEYSVRDASGSAIGPTRLERDRAAYAFGGEIGFHRLESVFGLAFAAEANNYLYSDGTPSDSHLGLFIVPKLFAPLPRPIHVWGGVGLGYMAAFLGQTSATSGAAVATLDSRFVGGFAYSPRFGLDVDVDACCSVGAAAAFTKGSATVSGKVVTSSFTTNFSEDISRSWWGIHLVFTARVR